MAVFSVYDYDRRVFEYYETAGAHQALGTAKFSTFREVKGIKGNAPMGEVPESVATDLPSGAVKVGEGDIPKGVIASKPDSLININGKFVLFIGVGFLAYKAFKGKK